MISLIVFGAIAIIMAGGLAQWSLYHTRLSRQRAYRELAFQIAESGIEYYRWHLAHAPADFTDGTGGPGPYVHDYFDKNNTKIGTFSLTITPPPIGSTLVVIESTGSALASPNAKRTIRAHYAIPTFAQYSIVANADMRFGGGTEVWGPVHSNGGIRFDGLAHNLVASAKSTYDDPDHDGNNEFGVHTHVTPADPPPPASVPLRTDVFAAGRSFPVPAVDFGGINSNLASLKAQAQADGSYFSNAGAYHVTFFANDTYTVKVVNSLMPPPSPLCYNQLAEAGWGTWSVNQETILGTYAFPPNGVIFFEAHVAVDGQIDTARITLASGRFPDNPSTRTSIALNNDITYATYDGSASLGLIAQNNITVGLYSENDLRIDAALIAQNGRVGRYYYNSWCGSNYIRSIITLLGMIGTNRRYGFAFTDGTGYQIRNLIYDPHLLLSPPPLFPQTTDKYSIVSWEEIQ